MVVVAAVRTPETVVMADGFSIQVTLEANIECILCVDCLCMSDLKQSDARTQTQFCMCVCARMCWIFEDLKKKVRAGEHNYINEEDTHKRK